MSLNNFYLITCWNDKFSDQFSSVTELHQTLCEPMDCSTPGFPVHHQLPEFTQTHVHQVGDAIRPSRPLSSPSPPASIFPSIRVFVPMSQFFASGDQSIGVSASASVLSMNIQDWFPLGLTGLISLQSKDSQESSPTPQLKSINSLALSFLIYWVKQTILVVFCFLVFLGSAMWLMES